MIELLFAEGIRLLEGEFHKMTEKEKEETEEMTSKYQAKISATGVRCSLTKVIRINSNERGKRSREAEMGLIIFSVLDGPLNTPLIPRSFDRVQTLKTVNI